MLLLYACLLLFLASALSLLALCYLVLCDLSVLRTEQSMCVNAYLRVRWQTGLSVCLNTVLSVRVLEYCPDCACLNTASCVCVHEYQAHPHPQPRVDRLQKNPAEPLPLLNPC